MILVSLPLSMKLQTKSIILIVHNIVQMSHLLPQNIIIPKTNERTVTRLPQSPSRIHKITNDAQPFNLIIAAILTLPIFNEFKQGVEEQQRESPQSPHTTRRQLYPQFVVDTLCSMDTSQEPNSLSDHDITLIAPEYDLKKTMSEDISRVRLKNSCIVEPQFNTNKLTFQPIAISTIMHQSLLKKKSFKKERQIQFYCFEDKKVVVDEVQLRQWQNQLLTTQKGRDSILCWQIIEQVIKKLCISQYNFEPLYVRSQTFELLVEQNHDNKSINDKQINHLIDKQKIVLRRSQRMVSMMEISQPSQKEVKEQISVEVLSPDKRDIVEWIDKGKTVANLKEKIATYYHQIVGQVIFLSYNTFRLVDNQTKISDLSEKVLEIYQAKHQHIDPSFIKRAAIDLTPKPKLFEVVTEETHNGDMVDLFVCEDWFYGKLYLKIQEKKLIERYTGGVVGYIQGDRIRILSLITLTGVKITDNTLKLEFQSKEGPQLITYTFQTADLLKQVLSHILIVTRIFNHLIANLE